MFLRKSDATIVRQVLHGRPEAFEPLVFRYQRKAYAIARAIVPSCLLFTVDFDTLSVCTFNGPALISIPKDKDFFFEKGTFVRYYIAYQRGRSLRTREWMGHCFPRGPEVFSWSPQLSVNQRKGETLVNGKVKRRVKLISGLPRKRLLKRIFYHWRNGEAQRRALGFYLFELHQRREYQALGFSSCVQFAECRLGMGEREARELLRVARALEELSEIDRASSEGEISWSKVREITRIATPQTEREWLEFAKQKLVREIEWAVTNSKRGEKPKRDGLGTPRATFNLRFRVSAAVNEVVQVALAKLMDERGAGATPADALKEMAEMAIRKDREGKVPGYKDRERAVYTVVYHTEHHTEHHTDGGGSRAWVNGEAGPVAIDPKVVDQVSKDAHVIEAEEVKDPGYTRAIRFGERGQVPQGDRDRKVSESERTTVLARDANRCLVCRSRLDPCAHHLESHANGGRTEIRYLSSLCRRCHTLAHEGFLNLTVDEKEGVVASDRDGEPLKRTGGAAQALEDEPELMTLVARKSVPPKVINNYKEKTSSLKNDPRTWVIRQGGIRRLHPLDRGPAGLTLGL